MNEILLGIILIMFGILFFVKPTIFRRWFWKKTSIAQRLLGPEAYIKYMRIIGILYVVGGIGMCIFGFYQG